MVEIIAGRKGKGKTKELLAKVNAAVKVTDGTIVYLDKNTKHMFELDRKVRLIDVSEYPVKSYEAFIGFLSGILSQDSDLQEIYLDSFLSLAFLTSENMEAPLDQIIALGEKFNVKFVLSVSEDKDYLPANAQDKVILAL